MDMRLILFDIDGTLLWTDGAGRRAIHHALLDELGTAGPIETYRFDGKTDPQIVRELLTLAGHPAAESMWRLRLAATIEVVAARVAGVLTVRWSNELARRLRYETQHQDTRAARARGDFAGRGYDPRAVAAHPSCLASRPPRARVSFDHFRRLAAPTCPRNHV